MIAIADTVDEPRQVVVADVRAGDRETPYTRFGEWLVLGCFPHARGGHATAMALLDQGGPDAVTIRGVGDRLGVTAKALYRYVEDATPALPRTRPRRAIGVFGEDDLVEVALGGRRTGPAPA